MMKKRVATMVAACILLTMVFTAGCTYVGTPGTSLPSVGSTVDFGLWGASGSEEPIVWDVLANDGSTVLLISDRIIDYRAFDADGKDFSASGIRSWLNGSFFSGAFTALEQSALAGGSGGKVSLLSLTDAQDTALFTDDTARAAAPTAFAQAAGCIDNNWWLADDADATHAVYVDGAGTVVPAGALKSGEKGVRPVIRVSLSAIAAVTEQDVASTIAGSADGAMGATTTPSSGTLAFCVHDGSLPSLTVSGYTLDDSGLTVNATLSAPLSGSQKVICLLKAQGGILPIDYIGWAVPSGGKLHFTGFDGGQQYSALLCVARVPGDGLTSYAGTVSRIDSMDALKITGLLSGDTVDSGSTVTFEAVGYGMDNTEPAASDTRWAPYAWWLDSEDSTAWSGSPYKVSFPAPALGVHTLHVQFVGQVYAEGEGWGSVPMPLQERTVQFTVAEPMTLTLSPASGTIYTSGRITITPSDEGGMWSFDTKVLSRSGNEFTGRKAGTARVTYTLGSRSVYADVTVLSSGLPATGQDFTPAALLCVLALLAGAAALALSAARRVGRHAR